MMNSIKKRLFYGLYDEGDKKMNYPPIEVNGAWRYRRYADGTYEAWCERLGTKFAIKNAAGNLFVSNAQNLGLPSELHSTAIHFCDIVLYAADGFDIWGNVTDHSINSVTFKGYSTVSHESAEIEKLLYVFGEYERG